MANGRLGRLHAQRLEIKQNIALQLIQTNYALHLSPNWHPYQLRCNDQNAPKTIRLKCQQNETQRNVKRYLIELLTLSKSLVRNA